MLTDEQKMKLEHSVRCGLGAGRILDDEYTQAALAALEVEILRTMDRTQPDETSVRETCYFQREAIRSLRSKLEIQRGNGRLAEQTLKDHGDK